MVKRYLRQRRRQAWLHEGLPILLTTIILAMMGNLFSVGMQRHDGHIMIMSGIGGLCAVAASFLNWRRQD